MKVSYIVTKDAISLVIDNIPYHVDLSNKNFDLIKTRLSEKNYDGLISLINKAKAIEKQIEEEEIVDMEIKGSNIFYKGKKIHNSIVNQIVETKDAGYDFKNLMYFLKNLLENTSFSVVSELYDWIASSKRISITEDGAFLAYKKIRSDYKDIYSGKMDNSPGKIVKMNRNEVNDNRKETCSNGLHFCSYNYLSSYGDARNSKVVIVKIFPQDVVSIPVDYSFQKGRCEKYEVVAEINDWQSGNHLDKPVDDYKESKEVLIHDDSTFENLTDNLSTSQMCSIYNDFHNKSVKQLKTKSYALIQMEKIFDKDIKWFTIACNNIKQS